MQTTGKIPTRPIEASSPASTLYLRELVLIAAGLGQVLEVEVGGRLLFSELVLLGALPFLLASSGQALQAREVQRFLTFATLWLCGAVFTDLIRDSRIEDLARGWSKIGFFIVNFLSIHLLVAQSRARLLTFLVSIFLGGAIKLAFFPSAEASATGFGQDVFGPAWKFGYGQAFSFLLLLSGGLLIQSRRQVLGTTVQFFAAAVDIVLDARNLFGTTLLSSAAAVFLKSGKPRRVSAQRIILVAMAAIATGWLAVSTYGLLASGGYLGTDAQDKYLKQSAGSFGLLLGGRTESLASTQAILDSPIIGHGSWARDTYYVMLKVQALEEAGYKYEGNPFQTDLIPSHSMILGAWVEAGILGAIFWGWAIWLTLRGLYAMLESPPQFPAAISFILLALLWDILFSPLGLDRRLVEPAYICTAILSIRHRL